MSGISYKASNILQNKLKYNGIEFDEDLGLNIYEAFYRHLDPQTGRWWEIDPKIDAGYENVTPYNSMFNDPVRYSDFMGDEAFDGGGDGVANLSKAANTWRTTQKIAGGIIVLGGGPEDPIADGLAGLVEVVGGGIALYQLVSTGEATASVNNTQSSLILLPEKKEAITLPSALQIPTYLPANKPKGGTYALTDNDKKVQRTGRTKDLERREKEHKKSEDTKDLDFNVDKRTDNKDAQRGREQQLHEKHNPPLNKIKPIRDNNPNKKKYMDAAKKEFGKKDKL
jgi:RHS repeat-associated protein